MKINKIPPVPSEPTFEVTLSQREVFILAKVLGKMNRAKYLNLGLSESDSETGYNMFDQFDDEVTALGL